MKEFIITSGESGRRLDKYIMHVLPGAQVSFIYKMLRKKNIVLNGKKASGNEQLCEGDIIRFYLADETFEHFSGCEEIPVDLSSMMPPVIYEDDDVLMVDKPEGMLSQRAKADDISLNEICLSYVRTLDSFDNNDTYTPSICNRLDRNTSGIVTFAKTYRAARVLSEAFRDHTLGKYYKCILAGKVEPTDLEGYLVKDGKTNTVKIVSEKNAGDFIKTRITPVRTNGEISLVDINLVTGKTHQIRAHLASIDHPIIGDPKYGDKVINDKYRKEYGIRSQMLVCFRMVFPDDLELKQIAGKTFEIPLPAEFEKVL